MSFITPWSGWSQPVISATVAAASQTPYDIFGASLVHEWDPYYSTVSLATGVSSISDLRGGKNLTQATGTKQPAFTSAGTQSYMTGDGTDDNLSNAAMSLSGDLTLLCVGTLVTNPADGLGHNFIHVGAGYALIHGFSNVSMRGAIYDATGQEIVTLASAPDTNQHAMVMYNRTGVSRKLYIDGGAGTAGARTSAMLAATAISLFSNNASGGYGNVRIYWAGIVSPSPTLADLNSWGAWASSRFGTAWTTAT